MALREELERQGQWLFRWRSYLPLLVAPLLFIALKHSGSIAQDFGRSANRLWEAGSVLVSFLGMGIRCVTAGFVPRGTSGRNTKSQVAEILNTTGTYSVVRNPLYLGNFLMVLGVALLTQVWWYILLTCIGFWFYYERIIFAEEEFLRKKFGEAYLEWAARTPIFFPCLGHWRKPALPFALKTVLRREFSSFMAMVASLTFFHFAGNVLSQGRLFVTLPWVCFFVGGLVIYLVFWFLKKKTRVLDVAGR